MMRTVPHKLAWSDDSLLVVGCAVGGRVQLPWALDLRLEGVGIEPALERDVPAPDAPKMFVAWLLEQPAVLSARTGAAEALPSGTPEYAKVLESATADILARTGLPSVDNRTWLHGPPAKPAGRANLGPWDHTGEHFTFLVERVCRSWLLQPDDALRLIQRHSPHSDDVTRDLIQGAYGQGFAAPGSLAQSSLEEYAYGENLKRQSAAQVARFEAAKLVKHPREDLLTIIRTARVNPDDRFALERMVSCERVINMGTSYLKLSGLPPWTGELAPGLTASSAPVALTNKEYADVGPLGEGLARILQERRYLASDGKTYEAGQFNGDARTPEGRHNLDRLRERAERLVHLTQNSGSAGHASFAQSSLLGLVVAFAPYVSALNAADAIAGALTEFATNARGGSFARMIEPEDVPRLMIAALASGNCPWVLGELATLPTKEEQALLSRALDPSQFRRTVLETIQDMVEVPSKLVYSALKAVGLVASSTAPSAADRARVAEILTSAGLTKAELQDKKLGRRRAWVRLPAKTADPTVNGV